MFWWKFNLNPKRFSILVVTAVCFFILEQPTIAQQIFGFLICVQVEGDDRYYIQQDLSYECYTPQYMSFRNFVIIPALLFYVVFVPLLFFVVLLKNRKEMYNAKVRMYLGAIYNEYQPKAFFWGVYLIVTKVILMFLKSTLDYDVKTKALSVFIVLYIYYALFIKFRPYQRKDLYDMELFSLITYLITIFGSIYFKDNSSKFAQWITILTITLLNLYVFASLIWGISKIYVDRLKILVKNTLRKFKKSKKLDIDFSRRETMIIRDGITEITEEITDISLEQVEDQIFGKDIDVPEEKPKKNEMELSTEIRSSGPKEERKPEKSPKISLKV